MRVFDSLEISTFFIIGQFVAASVDCLGEVLSGFNRIATARGPRMHPASVRPCACDREARTRLRSKLDAEEMPAPCEPKVVFAVPTTARVSWQSVSVPTKSESDNVNDHDTRRPRRRARFLRP